MKLFIAILLNLTVKAVFTNKHLLVPKHGNEQSKIEKWISDMIPSVAGDGGWVVFIDYYTKTDSSVIVLNTSTNKAYKQICAWEASVKMMFCIYVSNMSRVDNILDFLDNCKYFYYSAKFVILLPERPSNEIRRLFNNKNMPHTVFVRVFFNNDSLEVFTADGKTVSNYYLQTILHNLTLTTKSLSICYYESVPYTMLTTAAEKGLEMEIMDLVGRYLKVDIQYRKCNWKAHCSKNGSYSELWINLLMHTCDGVIGAWPCEADFSYFDYTITYFMDSAILVEPVTFCLRMVGYIVLRNSFMIPLILSYILVKLIDSFYLSRHHYRQVRISPILVKLKANIKQLLVLILLFAAIILSGIFQGKIFSDLIQQQYCGSKSLDETLTSYNNITIEWPFFFEFISAIIFYAKSRGVSEVYWQPNIDMNSFDAKKSHILRESFYNYEIYRRYGTSKIMLKNVETLKQIHIGLYLYKGHYFKPKITGALLVILESGLNMKGKSALEANEKRIKYQEKLLKGFKPINVNELAWLFWVYLIFGYISVIVFIVEMCRTCI